MAVTPFLKWAGGKRWLAKHLPDALPASYERYIEPFLGSGAVFFDVLPRRAVLSDANQELIRTYRAIRHSYDEIESRLRSYQLAHGRDLYYKVRATLPRDEVDLAARFIYLNRTCWNGLYRVNRKNEFNVPIGTKTAIVLPEDDFRAISNALSLATIICQDFELTIDNAKKGDLVYVDPPYTVKHNLNGFVKYNQNIFSWDDQIRLRDALVRARGRGCHIVVSNADHQSIRDLYEGFGTHRALPRASVIAGSASARGSTSELLVVHHG